MKICIWKSVLILDYSYIQGLSAFGDDVRDAR